MAVVSPIAGCALGIYLPASLDWWWIFKLPLVVFGFGIGGSIGGAVGDFFGSLANDVEQEREEEARREREARERERQRERERERQENARRQQEQTRRERPRYEYTYTGGQYQWRQQGTDDRERREREERERREREERERRKRNQYTYNGGQYEWRQGADERDRREERRKAPDPDPGAVKDLATACRILGVPVDADLRTVTSAWRDKCKKYHPDFLRGKGVSDEVIRLAERELQKINAAYELIKARHPAS